uniref:PD-(D/E)XK nuclease superfamily protein n=1 Tax=viral metagenome TaxID=1070528 RepID=A0A6H1ZJM7_9ZZZZ
MKVTIAEDFRKELLNKIAQREFSERTGTHQSDLIFCINKQCMRKLNPQPTTESQLLTFSLGWSTQRWLTGQSEDEPEIEKDGIKVTLDATWMGVPWELKATYMSNTKPIEESLHFVRQIMNQCYVTGTTEAYISRLEIMGNWKWVYRPKDPVKLQALVDQFGEDWAKHPTLTAVKFEFTQDELDHHWQWMQKRKQQYEGVIRTNVLLPKAQALASGMDFECGFCEYKEQCEQGHP